MFLFFKLYKLMLSEKILRLRNFAWGFLGVSFLVQGYFLVLIFPPFDHHCHLKSRVPSGLQSHLVGDDFCFLSGFKLNFCVSPRGF